MTDTQQLETDKALIEVGARALDAWDRLDWDATAAMFTPDGVLEAATGRPVRTRASIRQALDAMAVGLEDIDLQIHRIGVINGRVYTQRTDVVVIDGVRGELPTVGVMTIADGLIAHWTDYVDRTMMREHQLAIPTPEPRAEYVAHTDDDAGSIRVANEIIAAWGAQEWDAVARLFADDGVLHSVMTEPVRGRATLRRHLDELHVGLDRIDLHVKDIGVVDGRVFVERVDEFDMRGNHCELPVVGVLRVADGVVYEWLEYYDRRTLRRGMGLS